MRDIEEIRFELGEIADDLKNARARLIRIGTELEREHVSKEEARRVLAEGKVPPNLPTYLLAALDMVEDEDLNRAEETLRRASALSDQKLAQIWSERDKESALDLDVGQERPS